MLKLQKSLLLYPDDFDVFPLEFEKKTQLSEKLSSNSCPFPVWNLGQSVYQWNQYIILQKENLQTKKSF